MEAKLFGFHITDFEEVYAIIDEKNQRLHISLVNYNFNITLDLSRNLSEELEQQTKYGEVIFNQNVRKVVRKIINELNLT